MGLVAAIPRSSLHLAFLQANQPDLDLVLYRDPALARDIDAMFPGRGMFLGREARPIAAIGKLPRTFRANRAYYRGVAQRLSRLSIDRLILFLEGEPLERFLADRFDGPIELWEDGLSHYVDLTSAHWYAMRGAVQAMSGFYPRACFSRRADRRRFLVRDRFVHGNLRLPRPVLGRGSSNGVLIVGSPLIDDRILAVHRWKAGMAAIRSAIDGPVVYLPHPRETALARSMVEAIPGIVTAPQPHGIYPHLAEHAYHGFVAPVSTALLDIGAFDRAAFVPGLFGLGRMEKVLKAWSANPVATIGTTAELRVAGEKWSAQAMLD